MQQAAQAIASIEAAVAHPTQATAPVQVTMLELVATVGELTEDDDEVVAVVIHMLATHRARLCGSFKNVRAEDLIV